MQRHTLRTVFIYLILILSVVYIIPTLGWMSLSEEEQQARIERWNEEDRTFEEPNFASDMSKGFRRWLEFDRDWVINLGLDLQGGIHMVLGIDMSTVPEEEIQERLDNGWTYDNIVQEYQLTALRTIERRVNEFEAKEPIIQTYGTDQIQVQLPGEKDIERAKRLIMKTAFLEFKTVVQNQKTEQVFADIERRFPKQFIPYLRQEQPGAPFVFGVDQFDKIQQVVKLAREEGDLIPENMSIAFSRQPKPWDERQVYRIYLLDEPSLMTGEGLVGAVARPDPQSLEGNWHILFDLNATAGAKFGEVTEANQGRAMAIVVDNVVESAPTIQTRITTSGSIAGRFNPQEARDLAIALNSGSMPAKIREDFTGVVGATLGADSVRKGVISAGVGLLLVLAFMVIYYRAAGLIANLALIYNAVMVLAALAYFDATLTLPGIAGLILTIGMAVDANVLIFERIREELRNGRSLMASIDNGFVRARVTILDANITTLIAAAVLLQFGTGPIEGFAVTLSIGVVTSVFTALIVSRGLFDFLGQKGFLGKLSMMTVVNPDTKFGFLDKRRIAIGLSVVLIIVGMAMFGMRSESTSNPMFGVDFTTGTNMIVNLHGDQNIDVADVRAELTKAGFAEAIVQKYDQGDQANANRFLIRISELENTGNGESAENGDDTVSGQVQAALVTIGQATDATSDPVEMERVETVGPAVGKQLKWDAMQAILYAILFIIAYLWFRFELKFALGAVAALVHDVLVTVGLFALFGRQISLPVVAAILTIIGYSLNDTIVVFDRIREDLRLYRGRGLTYSQVMDLSINQTLSRTLLTSITTLIVVVVLFIFGGAVINDFAFALIAGVIVGTYSSIFVASPVVYYLQKFQGRSGHASENGESEGPGRRRRRKKKQSSDQEEAEASS